MSATKEERLHSTRHAAAVMSLVNTPYFEEEGCKVWRRAKNPWNNREYEWKPLHRIPLHWNWAKYDYRITEWSTEAHGENQNGSEN